MISDISSLNNAFNYSLSETSNNCIMRATQTDFYTVFTLPKFLDLPIIFSNATYHSSAVRRKTSVARTNLQGWN
uniref:Uncharacterized protein n=1 Tax=Arundo donax TaxID=35708 RepID=A0A0A8YMY4_ARUDO